MIPFINLANPLPTTPGTGLTAGQEAALTTATRRQPVASIAALKALTPSAGDAVNVLGYAAAGDGGGGTFYYDSASSATDNGGTVIAPTAGSGRWLRVYSGAVNVRWFGAKGDGATDDTTAVLAAFALSAASGLPGLQFPAGNYLVSSLDINANVNIVGAGRTATTLTITGYGTYVSLKYGLLLRGSGVGEGYVSVSGLYVYVQSTEPSQVGILITKRALLTDVRVKNAPGDGIYIRSVNESTEAPYFSRFDTVWSTHNGGSGIKLTENANGCQFLNCEANSNWEHGIHGVIVSNGQPATLVNTQILGGQASYNKKHGIYLENGWFYRITGIYAEHNSAIDGGDPSTGAYKNLHMGGASFSYVNLGGQGVATSALDTCIARNVATNNFVGYGGHVLQTGALMSFGGVNYGTGCNLTLNGASDCEHVLAFQEGTTLNRVRFRFIGSANALVVEAYVGSSWVEVQRVTNTGSGTLGFFGSTGGLRQTVTGSRGGNAALASLITALASLGLVTDSSS